MVGAAAAAGAARRAARRAALTVAGVALVAFGVGLAFGWWMRDESYEAHLRSDFDRWAEDGDVDPHPEGNP